MPPMPLCLRFCSASVDCEDDQTPDTNVVLAYNILMNSGISELQIQHLIVKTPAKSALRDFFTGNLQISCHRAYTSHAEKEKLCEIICTILKTTTIQSIKVLLENSMCHRDLLIFFHMCYVYNPDAKSSC